MEALKKIINVVAHGMLTAAYTKTQKYTKSMICFEKRAAVTYSEVTTPLTYPDLKKSMFKQICSFNGNMYRHIYIYKY